jgi:O-antigen/teichoic acid export membrane protein
MQVMLGLLDIGMGATVVREFADLRVESDGNKYKQDLLRTLEIVYWIVALLLAIVLISISDWLSNNWFKSDTLSSNYISDAIKFMSIGLGFQFITALYSNGLLGLQEHGRMNALHIMGSSLRHGCGVAVLFWQADIVWFFAVQAVVSATQSIATHSSLWKLISVNKNRRAVFRIEIFRHLWRFSLGMALTTIAAVLLANADRIALSKMESTAELGKYAIAFTATGLLQLAIQPFYRSFFPRFSELISKGDIESKKLYEEYFKSCQLMAAAIIPLGLMGWIFATELFTIWLGNSDETIVEVFRWLIIGITCSGLMWLPAAFQHAHGWTSLHAYMIAGALVFGAPVMVWAIHVYGTVGATTVWVIHGVSDITLGLWLMHKRLLVGKFFVWYRTVVLPPLIVCIPVVGLSWWFMPHGFNNWVYLVWIILTIIINIIAMVFYFQLINKQSFSWKIIYHK